MVTDMYSNMKQQVSEEKKKMSPNGSGTKKFKQKPVIESQKIKKSTDKAKLNLKWKLEPTLNEPKNSIDEFS